VGVEIRVEGLTKRFGRQTIWEDVTMTIPKGEISVLLGPSGTGKSVFLKTLVGLLRPNAGHIWINDMDLPHLNEHDLYQIRRLFGVLFQDGALFGSMNIYDNIAFPLREHTKKTESEVRNVVSEKMEMVGLLGSEKKLPGEISGGMRKRAGLARALVLDPEIILFDEPDSGLDPVRTAYLNQLIVDLNAQIEATFLIVTHDINTARTVPDNIGLLFRRNLVMFGPRMDLLTSDEPVVRQFLNGRREGPIGMAEEKDAAQLAAEESDGRPPAELPPIEKQLQPTSGVPRRTQRTGADGHPSSDGDRETVRVVAGKGADNKQAELDAIEPPSKEDVAQAREELLDPNDGERPGRKHAKSGGKRPEKGTSGTAPTTGSAAATAGAATRKSTKKSTAKKATAKKTTKKSAVKRAVTKATTARAAKKSAKKASKRGSSGGRAS
jgi:phospholipid/cholesterol/gamma-HCH transport system ATP-binding protein